MRLLGNLTLAGSGFIENLRAENLADDPVAPLAGQIWYNTTDGLYRGFDGTTVFAFTSAAQLNALSSELDTTQTGAGLNADGTYGAPSSSNYLGAATSLSNADALLDIEIKRIDTLVANIGDGSLTGIQGEIDAIEAGAGLDGGGNYIPPTGTNYLNGATTLKGADLLLDTAVKAAADAAGAAQTAADAAQDAAEGAQTAADGKVSKAGDSLTGNLAFGGTSTVTGLRAPEDAMDAATKSYVDNALSGLDFQPDVLAVQTDATLTPEETEGARYIITDPAALNAGFGTIEGVGAGDIVEYDGTDFQVVYDVSERGQGAMVWNRDQATFWYYNTTWSAFGGMDGVTPGVGLQKSGNVLNVALGAGIGQLPTNEVGVDLRASGGLFLTTDGSASSTSTDAQIAIKLDGTSLGLGANGLRIANAGVGAAQLAAAAFGNGLSGGAGTPVTVVPAPGGGLTVGATGVGIDPAALPFVRLDGSVAMTGLLTLSGAPTAALHAATKSYVDTIRDALQSSIADNTAALNGSTFVYDGSVSSATHVVNHNIGSRYLNVTVVDSDDKVILPDTVTFNTANQLTVTFASAITCKIVATGKFVKAA